MSGEDAFRIPHELEIAAEQLRELGWTVEPPSVVEELIQERRQEAEREDIPYVAIGAGEPAPWAHLDLNCPSCGEGPLPLQRSRHVDAERSGIVLHFITHCGGTWLRGPMEIS